MIREPITLGGQARGGYQAGVTTLGDTGARGDHLVCRGGVYYNILFNLYKVYI